MAKESWYIDKSIVSNLKNGDISAFRQIFDLFSDRLYRVIFSYLKNDHETEEMLQDIFLQIWETRESIDDTKSFSSFIYRITVNRVLNFLKHKVAQQKYERYVLSMSNPETDNLEEQVHFKELDRRIRELIIKLPSQQQTIFKLSKLEGLSNSEIAEEMQISIRTVENHIYRAIKFMKKHLKDDYMFMMICVAGGLIGI